MTAADRKQAEATVMHVAAALGLPLPPEPCPVVWAFDGVVVSFPVNAHTDLTAWAAVLGETPTVTDAALRRVRVEGVLGGHPVAVWATLSPAAWESAGRHVKAVRG